MLEAPTEPSGSRNEVLFREVTQRRDPSRLPTHLPRWVFLQWLAEQGWLLHGTPLGGLEELRPSTVHSHQPDDFSNTRGVYAASDGLWAMMYALRGPGVQGQSDMGLRLCLPDGHWSAMRYFLSYAPDDPAVADARTLLAPGFVYVLHQRSFQGSPPYEHPGLGFVQEAHWVSPEPVRPVLVVPVRPEDFPLPVRLHDALTVNARARSDPWGFPWLDEG